MPPVPQASSILASLGQAAFVWDIAADSIAWSDNAAAVFTDVPAQALASGTEFAKLIEPTRSIRSDALGQSAPPRSGEGVAYRIEYGVRTSMSAPVIWIEETGCWFAGPDGRPARAQGIVRVDNERHARDEQLVKLSRNDPLTGELNRTHLIASLAEAIEETARSRASCAFMLIGIDHLARVNDAFGFDVADAVIAEVSKRIRARLRGGDVLGRFSGNKFGLILRNCTVDDTNVAAERFLAGIRDEVVPTVSGPVSVTASIGAITVPRYARTADEAVNRAQETLDAAKRRRAGSFSMWRPNVERDAQRKRQHPRHRRDRHRAERAPHRHRVRTCGGGALASSRRSTNAWCGWSRRTARRCWRPISFRWRSGSASFGWSITACSNWRSPNSRPRRTFSSASTSRPTPRWIRTGGLQSNC